MFHTAIVVQTSPPRAVGHFCRFILKRADAEAPLKPQRRPSHHNPDDELWRLADDSITRGQRPSLLGGPAPGWLPDADPSTPQPGVGTAVAGRQTIARCSGDARAIEPQKIWSHLYHPIHGRNRPRPPTALTTHTRIDQRRVPTDSFAQRRLFFRRRIALYFKRPHAQGYGKAMACCPKIGTRRPVSFHWQRGCHRQAQKYSK